MDLMQRRAFVRDERWVTKVGLMAAEVAVDVGAEAFDADEPVLVERHTVRAALAAKVLQNGKAWAEPWAWAVTSNPGLTTDPSDGDIEFTIASLWDQTAGSLTAAQAQEAIAAAEAARLAAEEEAAQEPD